jgi:hypothetical protein
LRWRSPPGDLPCGRCRATTKLLDQKGTAVAKDTHHTIIDRGQLELPERVTVAVAELASAAREGLLALAVGTGLQVLQAMLAEDVTRLVGAKGRHQPGRTAVRHGSEPGRVTLGGRRVPVRRPRVRTADGTRELPVPTYQAFAATDLLDQLAGSGCWPSCPRAATGLGWSRSAAVSSRPVRAPRSRRSHAGSWPAPSMPWPNCWPPTCRPSTSWP